MATGVPAASCGSLRTWLLRWVARPGISGGSLSRWDGPGSGGHEEGRRGGGRVRHSGRFTVLKGKPVPEMTTFGRKRQLLAENDKRGGWGGWYSYRKKGFDQ